MVFEMYAAICRFDLRGWKGGEIVLVAKRELWKTGR